LSEQLQVKAGSQQVLAGRLSPDASAVSGMVLLLSAVCMWKAALQDNLLQIQQLLFCCQRHAAAFASAAADCYALTDAICFSRSKACMDCCCCWCCQQPEKCRLSPSQLAWKPNRHTSEVLTEQNDEHDLRDPQLGASNHPWEPHTV
jgi:hypothetical protein